MNVSASRFKNVVAVVPPTASRNGRFAVAACLPLPLVDTAVKPVGHGLCAPGPKASEDSEALAVRDEIETGMSEYLDE